MGLFDILKNVDFSSAIDMMTSQVRNGARSMPQMPGGLGGLLGAGALGTVLGNVMSKDLVKGVAMAGAGAVAWNFFKKWASQQDAQADAEEAKVISSKPVEEWRQGSQQGIPSNTFGRQANVDPTVNLVVRSMVYAARADGNMDATERQRINEIIVHLLPEGNVDKFVQEVAAEPVDPNKIAQLVRSDEQAQDVYRLSCAIIDIDQFMERNYLDALAKSLRISQNEQQSLENEASMARKQLIASLPG